MVDYRASGLGARWHYGHKLAGNTFGRLPVAPLPGTQVKSLEAGRVGYTSFSGGRTMVDFLWEHFPYTNKACGVPIGLGRYFGLRHVKQTWISPVGLRGRGGAPRLKAGRFDALLAVP